MRILMISPHPTYSPRGTPISVLNRCRALCALGHEIDLITYGLGIDVPVTGLTWVRAPVPGIRSVKIGPSLQKFPLDFAVFVKATVLAIRGRHTYDVIHTHEEAGLVGAVLSRLLRLPHVYDMGNDLSVVMANYGFSKRHILTRLATSTETATVRGANSVIAHFPSIAQRVSGIAGGRVPATVVANVPIERAPSGEVAQKLHREWSPTGEPVALYTGTLEKYQGVPALVEAVGLLRDRGTPCRLVLVGGSSQQQEHLRALVGDLDLDGRVIVAGSVGQEVIPSYLRAADVLVSPRAGGSNTPLKLFSYMQSGKPLVATRIAGHLQILDENSATLVEPSAEGLADGLQQVLADPALAARRAEVALRLAEEHYSLGTYLRAVATAYEPVGGSRPSIDRMAQAREAVNADLLRAAG